MTYPQIDPVAFSIGPLSVHWYGLTYLIGIGAVWALAHWRASKADAIFTREQVSDLIFYSAIGVIVGGRLGYGVFYAPGQWLADPLWIFKLQQGGMAFHGGMLGVLAAFWYFARKTGQRYFTVADFIVPMIPLALASGRIGNFINGELWGHPTDLPWGMVFPADPMQLVRHPSQLYQACFEGLLLFATLFVYSMKPRPTGVITGMFGVGYGIARIAAEFFREPDAHIGYLVGDWLTMGMLLSLPMSVVGSAIMAWGYRQHGAR